MFRYSSLTNEGVELMAEVSSGKPLIFTRAEYGSGKMTGIETKSTLGELQTLLASATALVDKKADLTLESIRVNGDSCILTGNVTQASVAEDFRMFEMGIFAKAGEYGEEVLFSYLSSIGYIGGIEHNESDYLTLESVAAGNRKQVTAIVVGRTENVQVVITAGDTDSFVLAETYNEKMEEIDGNLALSMLFDYVVDSDDSLLALANITDGSIHNVLVKSGTYTISDKMINPVRVGIKYIFGLPGAKLVFNYQKGLGVGETSPEKFIIENVDIEVNNETENDGYGIYYGGKLRNCNVKVTSTQCNSVGVIGCSADDTTATGVSSIGTGYGFYGVEYCTRCRSGETASTTATWGGINSHIDSDTCDIT